MTLTELEIKQIKQGAEHWLNDDTRELWMQYTCHTIRDYFVVPEYILTSVLRILWNKFLIENGSIPQTIAMSSFIEGWIEDQKLYAGLARYEHKRKLPQMRKEFMTWIVNLPEHKFNGE